MKTFFLCLFLSLVNYNFAQSNLTIFNNGDQSFYIILNGIKQNQIPQKNVVVTGVSDGGHAMKVVFANGASADIDKKLYLNEPSDIRMGIEFKKGIGKLKIISYVPSQGVQTSGVVFRPNDNAVYSDAPVVQTNSTLNQNLTSSQSIPQNTQSGTITTTQNNIPNNQSQTVITQNPQSGINSNTTNSTTTTTTVTTTGNATIPANTNVNGNLNLNVGLNGMNMTVTDPLSGQNLNMNINLNGVNGMNSTGSSTNSSTQTTTTTITSSSQTTSNSTRPNSMNTTTGNATIQTNTPVNTNSQMVTSSSNSTNSNQGMVTVIRGTAKINCSKTLGNIDAYVKELKELSFESDQVDAIEKDLVNSCLTSAQSYKIVELLTFESNRLDIAKFLSDRMINRDKAGELLPLFTFDSNKVEYKEYIR